LDNNDAPTSATVKIDGQEEKDWYFELHSSTTHDHTISVAYGPIESTIGSVRSSLKYPGPNKPSSPFPIPSRISFHEITIEDLMGS
jgi:hypothetical protein